MQVVFRRRHGGSEGTSALPWLGLIFGVLLTTAMFHYQPWRENWQLLRTLLFSEQPIEQVEGRWVVTRAMRSASAGKRILPPDSNLAVFNFMPDGTAYVRVGTRQRNVTYQGLYNQRGDNLFLSNMRPLTRDVGFPSQALATATRTTASGLVLNFGKEETLFLRPLEEDESGGEFVWVGQVSGNGR